MSSTMSRFILKLYWLRWDKLAFKKHYVFSSHSSRDSDLSRRGEWVRYICKSLFVKNALLAPCNHVLFLRINHCFKRHWIYHSHHSKFFVKLFVKLIICTFFSEQRSMRWNKGKKILQMILINFELKILSHKWCDVVY